MYDSDHTYTKQLVCPYCGHYIDGYDYSNYADTEGTEECPACQETFEWIVEFEPRFTTRQCDDEY